MVVRLKSGEEEEAPLVLALGVDAALVPVEAQPEEPVLGEQPLRVAEQSQHLIRRERRCFSSNGSMHVSSARHRD